jgi:hypothetical protein
MDLLAMAMADGQLVVHRLNWQRLWAVSPGEHPSELNYSSSSEKGHIRNLLAFIHSLLYRTRISLKNVCSLSWWTGLTDRKGAQKL